MEGANLSGVYKPPTRLRAVYYGPSVVASHLLSTLPSPSSRAYIITNKSLTTKTPLVKQVEDLLGRERHAGTFSEVGQHAPIRQLEEATALLLKAGEEGREVDTIISVGGGSPIDAAKAVSHRVAEKRGKGFLTHVTIPTTLSAAECTPIYGYTDEAGVKITVVVPECGVNAIFYDPGFAVHTPPGLFLSSGIRALDHAVGLQYHPMATLVPTKTIALDAIRQLFEWLPKYKRDPKDADVITSLFLAAYESLGFKGENVSGGLGLSHTMGYALGSPYGIPHGITSCLTLGHVVKLKAKESKKNAAGISAILPVLGQQKSGDDEKDAETVGNMILHFVKDLGLSTTLTERGVGKDQIDIICSRATKGMADKKDKTEEEQDQTKAVRMLVESLY